jgi:hypothetical protein
LEDEKKEKSLSVNGYSNTAFLAPYNMKGIGNKREGKRDGN